MLRQRRRTDPVVRRLVELGLAEDGAVVLSRAGTQLDLPAGTTLVRQGERGDQAFLLLDGTAQVLTGEGVVPIGAGAVVGELATLDRHRVRNATVVASSDIAVLVFDVATFRSLARDTELRPHLAPAR